jgi:integrase
LRSWETRRSRRSPPTTIAVAGKPLAGSTVNRHLTQAGRIFKHAKCLKLVPRSFIASTRGIERTPERPDRERYLRLEEVERLLAVARVMDRTWGKMPALITVAYHTGLRVGSILRTRGRDLDLDAGTLTIKRTKNGDPITAGLSSAAIAELKRLPKVGPDDLIFGNRGGKPFTYRPLWCASPKRRGFPGASSMSSATATATS